MRATANFQTRINNAARDLAAQDEMISAAQLAVMRPGTEPSEDYYAVLLSRIRGLAPESRLLRGPAHLDPIQASSGSSDIDVLVPAGFDEVKAFLKVQGFRRVYKPQVYLERFRRWLPGQSTAFTVDLYRAERWGWGFSLAGNGHAPADPDIACLLHAVADGKGTKFYEKERNGPPWSGPNPHQVRFGSVGRVLWRTGGTTLLTLYLAINGVIRPHPADIMRNLFRRLTYRLWQASRKTGLEIALLGVDGVGKSSVASALLQLPAKVTVVYMGPHDYQTWIMRRIARGRPPAIVRQVVYRLDLLARRLTGWWLARKGWIVIYDRHPAEGIDPQDHSFRNLVKTFMERLHAWPVDHTFWLTGDYQTIYARKKEYSPAKLESIDARYGRVLDRYRIPFEAIDVTENDLPSVTETIRSRILRMYRQRNSTRNLPGLLREILT